MGPLLSICCIQDSTRNMGKSLPYREHLTEAPGRESALRREEEGSPTPEPTLSHGLVLLQITSQAKIRSSVQGSEPPET